MAEQICPTCGCTIGEKSHRDGEELYCCEPCATEGQCECGCCEIVGESQEE